MDASQALLLYAYIPSTHDFQLVFFDLSLILIHSKIRFMDETAEIRKSLLQIHIGSHRNIHTVRVVVLCSMNFFSHTSDEMLIGFLIQIV